MATVISMQEEISHHGIIINTFYVGLEAFGCSSISYARYYCCQRPFISEAEMPGKLRKCKQGSSRTRNDIKNEGHLHKGYLHLY